MAPCGCCCLSRRTTIMPDDEVHGRILFPVNLATFVCVSTAQQACRGLPWLILFMLFLWGLFSWMAKRACWRVLRYICIPWYIDVFLAYLIWSYRACFVFVLVLLPFQDVGADRNGHPGEAAPHGSVLVLGVLGVQGGCPQVRHFLWNGLMHYTALRHDTNEILRICAPIFLSFSVIWVIFSVTCSTFILWRHDALRETDSRESYTCFGDHL